MQELREERTEEVRLFRKFGFTVQEVDDFCTRATMDIPEINLSISASAIEVASGAMNVRVSVDFNTKSYDADKRQAGEYLLEVPYKDLVLTVLQRVKLFVSIRMTPEDGEEFGIGATIRQETLRPLHNAVDTAIRTVHYIRSRDNV